MDVDFDVDLDGDLDVNGVATVDDAPRRGVNVR
jgi:hypothetical protein